MRDLYERSGKSGNWGKFAFCFFKFHVHPCVRDSAISAHACDSTCPCITVKVDGFKKRRQVHSKLRIHTDTSMQVRG